MKLRKLRKHAQEKHGYKTVISSSRTKPTWDYDERTGRPYRLRSIRVTVSIHTTGNYWRD